MDSPPAMKGQASNGSAVHAHGSVGARPHRTRDSIARCIFLGNMCCDETHISQTLLVITPRHASKEPITPRWECPTRLPWPPTAQSFFKSPFCLHISCYYAPCACVLKSVPQYQSIFHAILSSCSECTTHPPLHTRTHRSSTLPHSTLRRRIDRVRGYTALSCALHVYLFLLSARRLALSVVSREKKGWSKQKTIHMTNFCLTG